MTKFELDELKRRLDFHYNGDLGALQHKTTAFCTMLYTLLSLGQITKEQYNELGQILVEHFKSGLQDAIKNPHSYIN